MLVEGTGPPSFGHFTAIRPLVSPKSHRTVVVLAHGASEGIFNVIHRFAFLIKT